MHSPDWQPAISADKRGRLEDKAVECRSIDVDEALGLDIDEDEEDNDSPHYKPIGDCVHDGEHVYHELEVEYFYEIAFMLRCFYRCKCTFIYRYAGISTGTCLRFGKVRKRDRTNFAVL